MWDKLALYLQYPFVRYAIIVGVLIALCSSLLGVILVLKRFSYIGDGLSHVAFGAMAIAAVVGLSDRMGHYPNQLSGGQQQRVAIARALIHHPMVLFADEPTGNLDPTTAENVTNLLLSLRDELKQTLVIVTHDERLAARADRAYRMVEGEMYVRR